MTSLFVNGQQVSESMVSEQVSQTLKLVRSSKQERRLAGLYLLTRLLPKQDKVIVQQVLTLVGWDYVRSLLAPLALRQIQQQDVNIDTYVGTCTLGVTLLRTFLSVCKFHQEPKSKIIWLINPLLCVCKSGHIQAALINNIENQDAVFDELENNEAELRDKCQQGDFSQYNRNNTETLIEILQCLRMIAQGNQEAQDHMLRGGILECLAHYLCASHQVTLSQNCLYLFQQLLANNKVRATVQSYPQQIGDIVVKISQLIHDQDCSKEDIKTVELNVDLLNSLLFVFPPPLPEGQHFQQYLIQSQYKWAPNIWHGLWALFQNKLPVIQKYNAYRICASMIFLFQSTWLSQTYSWQSSMDNKVDISLMELVVSSMCTELQLLLRDCLIDSYKREQTYDIIPACFVIMEAVVDELCALEQGEKVLFEDGKRIFRLFQGIEELVFDVLCFIREVKDGQLQVDENLLIGCVRVIGRYISESPESFIDQIQNILEYMVQLKHGEGKKFLEPYLFWIECIGLKG